MIPIRNVAIPLFSIGLSLNFAHAQDLSNYRGFRLGMSLTDVIQQREKDRADQEDAWAVNKPTFRF